MSRRRVKRLCAINHPQLRTGFYHFEHIDDGAVGHRHGHVPDLTTLLIVCPLVFLGGLVDSIAGGGGLITLPGYLLAGVPPHMAIGTNKLSSAMGMAISTVRLYRGGFIDLKMSVVPVLSAFVGSLVGARIALMVPPSVFQIILVLCLPVAAFLVMRDKTLSPDGEEMEQKKRWLMLGLVSFACGAYDGFYGPGAGTFMLLGFAAAAKLGVRDAAGQMKIVNFSSGIAALVLYAATGHVDWVLGALAGCFGITGHYIGSGLVMKNGGRIVRPIILTVLAILFVKTAWDYLA